MLNVIDFASRRGIGTGAERADASPGPARNLGARVASSSLGALFYPDARLAEALRGPRLPEAFARTYIDPRLLRDFTSAAGHSHGR